MLSTAVPRLVSVLAATLLFSSLADAQDSKPVLQAGAVTSNITPPLGELIVGGWQPIPAKHVHDELYARCLVLDDGSQRLAIVLCDNVGIPQEVFDAAKQQVAERIGIPAANQLMASTHTHSATTARGPCKMIRDVQLSDYQQFLVQRIADGVQRAVNQLEPAKIGWGSVLEPSEVFNRRWYVTDPAQLTNPFGGTDTVRMNPPRASGSLVRAAGPVDPEVSFVSVQATSGRPIALLANYSLHYVGGVPGGEVSADYFGYFAKYVAQKLGAADQTVPFVGMLSNGTSGDVNNINFQEKGVRYKPYEKMQEVAEKVASKVYEAHASVQFHDWVPLSAAATELTLQVRKPTLEMLEHFDKVRAAQQADGATGHRREMIYAERIADLTKAPDQVNIPLQVIQIGDLAINAIPFEVFTEIGLDLKAQTPFARTFTIELANGSFGYLPTPQQHKLGGYETWLGTNFVQLDASEKIIQSLLQLQKQLHARSKTEAP